MPFPYLLLFSPEQTRLLDGDGEDIGLRQLCQKVNEIFTTMMADMGNAGEVERIWTPRNADPVNPDLSIIKCESIELNLGSEE